MRSFPKARGKAALAGAACVAMLAAMTPALAAEAADDTPPAPAAPAAPPKETVRPEVGTPLQAAQGLMKDKKFKEALAKIAEAEAVANRTAFENFMIASMRASVAAQSDDTELAVTAFEAMINSGRLTPAQSLRFMQGLAVANYKLKDYGKSAAWAARYLREGGTEPSVQDIMFFSYYNSNDFKAAASELQASVDADVKAGRTPSENHLQMLLNSDIKLKNTSGSAATLELLLTYYPQKQYWDMALNSVAHRSGAERLELDLLRLQFALGDLKKDGDYMELAQLAMEAGFPSEGKKVLDQGFAAGILGKGAEADRQRRLQTKASKDAADDVRALDAGDIDAERAKTGDGMVNTGFNYVVNGKAEHGLQLMEGGLKKGGLRHPEDSKLHLGIAYYLAGDRARAIQTLRSVQSSDGAGDIAHLWAIHISNKH